MYLAATSDFMVSPSEMVDIVWHQHLIFTESYQKFCAILGKKIKHIPSTHNKEEYQKFWEAKARTKSLYLTNFGEQPASIWEYTNIYASLGLEKAKLSISNIVFIGFILFLILTIPSYFVLQPIFIHVDNPYFLVEFISISIFLLIGLYFFNRKKLTEIVGYFPQDSFIFSLQPLELVFLQTQKLSNVVDGVMNQMIRKKQIILHPDFTIEASKDLQVQTLEQHEIASAFQSLGKTFYPSLMKKVSAQPVFSNIANAILGFQNYFTQSKKFSTLFQINLGLISILFMTGFIRLVVGVMRDKPVTQITIALILFIVIMTFWLYWLRNMLFTNIIPNSYKETMIAQTDGEKSSWEWDYFLLGKTALVASFIPIVNYTENDKGSTCGTSGGGSDGGGGDGGGCGGGCGGCGGGCGGCGGG
jgi:hypothetical protein